MSDSQSNKSLPSISSSSCEDTGNQTTGNVSAKISIPSANAVTVNGSVVTAAVGAEDGGVNEETIGVSTKVQSTTNEKHEQTVTIVTATVATTTVQSTSNTTKTVVKQKGEKLANFQRMTGGSAPCCRVQVGGPVKQQSGPAAVMTAGSGRSSVSSLASSSAGTSSSSCCCNGVTTSGVPQLHHQQSLNQALAIVANKWDREQRIQDQETTRRLTLLKQRKISAILKVETLQKSLKSASLTSMGSSNGSFSSGQDPSNLSMSQSVQNQLVQVKELEEEVAAVDSEMAKLGQEREHNLSELNQKRVQHVTTLQQMGLLGDSLSCSIDDPYGVGRWRSEVDLKGGNSGIISPRASSASGTNSHNAEDASRKISPPLANVLASSRLRSGSDPSLASLACENGEGVNSNPVGYHTSTGNQDENRKPSTQSTGSGKNRSNTGKSPGASPKTRRRNPLRMLSNAIDFRVRTKKLMNQHHSRKKEGGSVDSNSSSNRLSSFEFGRNRPKSADFERVGTISEDPGGTIIDEEGPPSRQLPVSALSIDSDYSCGSGGLQIPTELNNKSSNNTLQLHSHSKPLYYSSAVSLTTSPPTISNELDPHCTHPHYHHQISTEQINMLVTPDTPFILNAISPTSPSPRTPSHHGVSPTSLASRLLNGASFSPFSLTTSRHSLPNLDPDDMEDALNQAKLSPYTTNPRRKGGRHKHNLYKTPKQLPSTNFPKNKLGMMVHAHSDPVSSSDQIQSNLKSAITTSPHSMSLSHQDCSINQIQTPQELYSENYVHPPPLENRNSAPEIVVLSPGRELPKIPIQSSQQDSNPMISKKIHNSYGVEDRINRAKAKVFQNGGLFRSVGGGSKDSSYFLEDEPQLLPSIYQPGPTSIATGPSSNGNGGHVRQKLSTRFHSAQKLNYKLAALSNFASAASANINVRRSRTFNISDMHEQLNMVGNGGNHSNIIYDSANEPIDNTRYYTKTLPKQMKTSSGNSSSHRKTQTLRKLEPSTLTISSSSARDSNSSSSSGVCCGSYSSDITTTEVSSSNGSGSVGDLGSGASSTTSSRKSSNSSSKDENTIEDDGTGTELRSEIKEDALKEIAAFESFIANYVVQQSSHSKVNHHDSHGCVSKQSGVNPKRNQKAQLEVPSSLNTPVSSGIPPSGPLRGRRMIANGGVVRTLERQKKIMTSQNSEEA